jgi:LmbE family N-acetylglucosaminyl deacetylase
MKILVISAHPDDEILGCGATMLRHLEKGDEVSVCIVTTSTSPRWSDEYRENKLTEARSVDHVLGIKNRFYCNLRTTELNLTPSVSLNGSIADVIEKVDPDIIYTHFQGDVNTDHVEIFNAVMVCTRPISKKISLLCFETLSSTEWGTIPFNPNFYVKVSKEHIEKKIEAFTHYESEVRENPHPRSPGGIINLAKKRGNDICENFAEAFVIIKDYWM